MKSEPVSQRLLYKTRDPSATFHAKSLMVAVETGCSVVAMEAGRGHGKTMPLLSVSNSYSTNLESRKFAGLNNSTFESVCG